METLMALDDNVIIMAKNLYKLQLFMNRFFEEDDNSKTVFGSIMDSDVKGVETLAYYARLRLQARKK